MKAPDETDIRIGIGLGFDLPITEIAERVDRDAATVHRRRADKPDFIEAIRAYTSTIASTVLEKRIKAVEEKGDLKQRLSQKAYARLEELLSGEGAPDGLTLAALKEALDRTEGKALDRKAILSRHEETITHRIVSDETVNRLARFMARNELLLPAPPVDAITIEPEPTH